MGGPEDPNGDFTTVGYEDLLKLHNGGIGTEPTVDGVLELLVVFLDEFDIIDGVFREGHFQLGI